MKTNPSLVQRASARSGWLPKALLLWAFVTGVAMPRGWADQSGQQPDCYNHTDPKPCDTCDCPANQGANPVDAASGDVMRNLRDLEVFGGVGEHQLNWSRYGHSRSPGGLAWFGDGHTWRHSYQWEMAYGSGGNQNTVICPDGAVLNFWYGGWYDNQDHWTTLASTSDQLTQTGNDFYLRRVDGYTYHFARLTAGGGQVYFQLQDFTDSFGNAYHLTYDASNRLVLVTEPAGRWLRVTYQDIPLNQEQFTTFYAQASQPPAGWNTVAVNAPGSFRYLRYYSTDAGGVDAYGNVAEVEFYDTAGHQLSGTPFGSSPSWENSSSTFDKAFDGDTNTFFDFASPHFGFTGLDLGAGNEKAIGQVRFFARAGFEGRMNGTNYEGHPTGCRFEGANVAPVTETVIAKVEAGYGSGSGQTITRTVQYNYTAMPDTVLQSNWLNLTGASYGDGSQAQYTYQILYAGQHPLLLSADDPRIEGTATRIKYEFWTGSMNIDGSIYAEHDFTSNQILAKFEGEGGAGRKISYANGGAKHVVMAADHNATSSADELGNTTSYNYGSNNGFLISKTDSLNHTTTYTRDAQGRVLSATYADNSTESWTLDALGHILTHKDERGYTTIWTRDGNGRTVRIDYPDGGYEMFTYNGIGQVLTHRQTNGGTESFVYDGRGLKTGWTDALNHTTIYGYDANDLLASVTDPLNHTTVYTHNERGQVTQATYADHTSVGYGYDAYGNQLSRTNELGKVWSATFDTYKRRITATDPLNRTTQYWYDEPGAGSSGCGGCGSGLGGTGNHLTTVILPSGKTTRIGYDLAWRKTSQTIGYNTPAAATTNYAYDAAGNVQIVTDPRGKATTLAYDNRNRRTSTTDPLNHVTLRAYDVAGNVASETRADQGVTIYAYDPLNRRTKATDPLNQVTQIAYDVAGNLTLLTDARSNGYGFAYDGRNRKTRMSYPDASHEDWAYDAAGNAATYTTRAGQVKTCAYDGRNRETDAAWNDSSTPEVMTAYDLTGRVLTLNNANSALTYAYDDAGQLSSETQDIAGGPSAKTVAYAYDADGNRMQLTNPDGTAVTYAYTTRNQISSVSLSGPPPLATYTYDLAGNRTGKRMENGTAAIYTYDDASWLNSLVQQGGSTTFASFSYAYNSVNNRTSVTYASGLGDVYSYDPIDQLTGVQYGASNPTSSPASPQSTQAYAHDAVGNRTVVTQNGATTAYSANNLNEYTQVGAVAQTSDGNGNVTSPINGFTCTYDAQNRLISMGKTAGGGRGQPNRTTTYTFAYDAHNRCVQRTFSSLMSVPQSSRTSYVYDDWNLVAEFDDSAVQIASYVHGATTDEVLVCTNGSGTSYYHQDCLGSTVALTNTNGQVVEQYRYDIFGSPTIKNAAGSTIADSGYSNRFLFTGREWLSNVGVYDYRNRVYSPSTGRFLQIDPIRFKGRDVNLYRYVGNEVIDRTDPYGLRDGSMNNVWDPDERKQINKDRQRYACNCIKAGGTMMSEADAPPYNGDFKKCMTAEWDLWRDGWHAVIGGAIADLGYGCIVGSGGGPIGSAGGALVAGTGGLLGTALSPCEACMQMSCYKNGKKFDPSN